MAVSLLGSNEGSNAAVRNSCKVLEHRVTGTQQVLTYGPRFLPKMGLKKNGKKVQLQLHESVDSQESLEMDEYSDEDDGQGGKRKSLKQRMKGMNLI